MCPRVVRWFSILVGCLLLGSIFYAGALTYPYHGVDQSYAIADESTEIFDVIADRDEIDTANATPVETLSPATQQAFEDAKEQPRTEYDTIPDGWQRLSTVPLCKDVLVVCDGYTELPAFPKESHDAYESDGAVEANGDVYIVRTGSYNTLHDVRPLLENFAKIVIYGPYAAFLAYIAVSRRYTNRRQTRFFVGYGASLAGLGLVYPYALMFAGASFLAHLLLLVALAVVTWAVIRRGLSDTDGRT